MKFLLFQNKKKTPKLSKYLRIVLATSEKLFMEKICSAKVDSHMNITQKTPPQSQNKSYATNYVKQ